MEMTIGGIEIREKGVKKATLRKFVNGNYTGFPRSIYTGNS
jgi:hypothetical protein